MEDKSPLRLLAPDNNLRGDLFTRLAKDIFFALGYEDLRLDVQKSGRELDLQGQHRFEPRRVVAECKAHSEKIGGDVLNKFFGALTRERKKAFPIPVAGYCVSLSGFTGTGIEQELESGDDKIILLDATRIVIELERCHVIASKTKAAERAGHCAAASGLSDAVIDGCELLAHNRGYVWAVYYAHGKAKTHFALIHADGTPLAQSVAIELVETDRLCGGTLNSLRYLSPVPPTPDRASLALRAGELYRKWLGEECGYIHLDGLPADADLSATRLKLERLFVPLNAIYLSQQKAKTESQQQTKDQPASIGGMLAETRHLALLALPGGGKSTLLKRIATAYAFPGRRQEVADNLPQREWLPLILRCRELRDRAQRPIIELLDDVPRFAGLSGDECTCFRESIHAALRDGRALLLIDGLDEISDEGARQAFASNLRTFVATFPQAAVIITSREAGFRLIAGVIVSAFDCARLAPLGEKDVLQLCERWHVEVLGDTEKVRSDAKELAGAIWTNGRIRTLTENPLLLTTLLVVRRWIGELPRNRTALYREAIRVLVRTWNVEGYAPLDEDETLAQLSYVACAMLQEGKQQIGQKQLLKHLQNARVEMEAELQFARISPHEFVDRIEFRSSLLMQTGHERINGHIQPLYEFRHLTFQEYLAARGYVEEQYPGRNLGPDLTELLEPHFRDEKWQEVIPLAAVLMGRKAEKLVKRLIAKSEDPPLLEKKSNTGKETTYLSVLYQCVLDEVQVTGPTLRTALLQIARDRTAGRELDFNAATAISRGKFGPTFQEIVEESYLANTENPAELISAVSDIASYLKFRDQRPKISVELTNSLLNDIQHTEPMSQIRAALVCMQLAFRSHYRFGILQETDIVTLKQQIAILLPHLQVMAASNDLRIALPACWAFAWLGQRRLCNAPPQVSLLLSFYRLWRKLDSAPATGLPCWAFASQQLLHRDAFGKDSWDDCDDFLRASLTRERLRFGGTINRYAACVIGWYRHSPWSDAELVELLREYAMSQAVELEPTVSDLLGELGEPRGSGLQKKPTSTAQSPPAPSHRSSSRPDAFAASGRGRDAQRR
jgi:hypothetical protein